MRPPHEADLAGEAAASAAGGAGDEVVLRSGVGVGGADARRVHEDSFPCCRVPYTPTRGFPASDKDSQYRKSSSLVRKILYFSMCSGESRLSTEIRMYSSTYNLFCQLLF